MRNLINMITESTVHFSYEQNGFPHALYNAEDVQKAVAHEHIKPDTIVTVYKGEDKPFAAKATDVPEIAKHLPQAAEAAPVHMSVEINGFPTELDASNVEKLIAKGSLKPESFVSVARDGQRGSLVRADRVPELAGHFAKEVAKPKTPVVHVTHALDTIAQANISTEQGAIAQAVNKAIGEARTYFPRDTHALMTNPHAMRNIKDGLKLIAAELKHYGVVMESNA